MDLMKENGFEMAMERSRRYPAQTITDADYTDDIVLLVNIPAKSESLLHNLELVSGCIDLHVNADKTEYMGFLIKVATSPYLRVVLGNSWTS